MEWFSTDTILYQRTIDFNFSHCICLCACVHATVCLWRSRDNWRRQLFPSPSGLCRWNLSLVASAFLYSLSWLTGPKNFKDTVNFIDFLCFKHFWILMKVDEIREKEKGILEHQHPNELEKTVEQNLGK